MPEYIKRSISYGRDGCMDGPNLIIDEHHFQKEHMYSELGLYIMKIF